MPIYARICQINVRKWHFKRKKYYKKMLGKPINTAFSNEFTRKGISFEGKNVLIG